MTTAEKRQLLHSYVDAAPIKKVKAIYTLLEEQIEEPYDHWQDEEFVAELLRRQAAYLNGTERTYSLEEVSKMVKETIKKVRAKKNQQG